jgi:hypothetical protein
VAIQPGSIDSTKYRTVEYIGGRILQDRELKLMQQLEGDVPQNGKFNFGALYNTGALLNVTVSIAAATVTLSATNPLEPMLVYLNNNWEVFATPPIMLTAGAVGVNSFIYLNYVLWRVTFDGTSGTLRDNTLVDAATHEATAEMGQLQIYVGADDHGSIDTNLMFDRNTVPYPMVILASNGLGSLTLFGMISIKDQLAASNLRPGMVAMSTATSSIAAATDDTRLSDQRTPLPLSVNTSKVQVPNITGGSINISLTDQHGATQNAVLATVATGDTNGGINSKRLFFDGWGVTINDIVTLLWGKVTGVYAVLFGHENRITTLEQATAPSYAYHIGHKLGESTPGIAQSHPPVVDNAGDPYNTYPGFQVLGTPASNPAGQGAFSVLSAAAAIFGMLDHSGNYQYLNPGAAPLLIDAADGYDFRDYFGFANAVLNFMRSGGTFPFLGDVTGPGPRSTTVAGLLNRPLSPSVPNVGDVMTWNGAAWAPQAPGAQGGITNSRKDGSYAVFQWNVAGSASRVEIAFGSGTVMNGSEIEIPAGFTYAGMWRIVSPLNIFCNTGTLADALGALTMGSGNQFDGTANVHAYNVLNQLWPRNVGGSETQFSMQWFAICWRAL